MELALDTAAKTPSAGASPGARVFTLGPLIHNPQAVAQLEAAGIFALSEAELDDRVDEKPVVIRAHGVPPALLARLTRLGAHVVDATCPLVLASQRKARDFAARGYTVVIAGEAGHAEVAGIAGCVENSGGEKGAIVVGSPEEASLVDAPGPLALIAQTTIRSEEYEAIREALAKRFPELEVVDSICPCTSERLDALADLAASVDGIVVVGGRNSANTARLYASARELLPSAWLVETAEELPEEVFRLAVVGLTAGASTPDSLIKEVERTLYSRGAGV
jgi:4-hydroxy-3-methylbut-2-en-1-yl diphosphate reductase